MKRIFFMISLFLSQILFAQNRILNPGFEINTGVAALNIGDIGGYMSPTGAVCGNMASNWCAGAFWSSPDYYHTLAPTPVYRVPQGTAFERTANNAYAGIITYKNDGYGDQREYLQAALVDPVTHLPSSLIVGQTYVARYWVYLSDNSTTSSELGIAFVSGFTNYAADSGAQPSHPLIVLTPPVLAGHSDVPLYNQESRIPTGPFVSTNPVQNSNVIPRSNQWTELCFSFTPTTNNIDHILIGNFLNNASSAGVPNGLAYYFVDDVEVFSIDTPVVLRDTICFGDSTVLNAGAGTAFQWYRNDLAINCQTSTVTVNAPGTYKVIKEVGCATVTQTIAIIDTLPHLYAGFAPKAKPDTLCCGSSDTLKVKILSGSAPFSYLWSTGATTRGILITPTTTTNYSVTVTDACGLSTVLTKTIYASCPTLSFTPPVVYGCTAGRFKFPYSLTGGVGPYTWSPSDPNPFLGLGRSVSLSSSLLYSVTDAYHCTASAAVSVTITSPKITITSTIRDCGYLLTANVTDGTAPYSYSWSTGSTTAFTNVTLTGSYTVTVTDSRGCTAVKSISITNTIKPVHFTLNCPTTSLCEGDTFKLISTLVPVFLLPRYAWSTGATTSSITVIPPVGVNTYSLTVTNPANGCREVQTCTINVVKCCRINASFNATVGCDSVRFTNVSTNCSSSAEYTWEFGDGLNYVGINPPAHFYEEGAFTVCLYIKDGECRDTFCRDIIVNKECKGCCIADFDFSGCADEISFINKSHASDPSSALYTWSFGDLSPDSHLKHPKHTFVLADPTVAQTFTVCLTIKDASGCQKTLCKTITVKPCCEERQDSCCFAQANFSYELTNCYFADFHNRSNVCVPPGGTIKYIWSFGESSISDYIGFEPPAGSIHYPTEDIYAVSLNIYIYDQYGNPCTKSNYTNEMFASCKCFSNAKLIAEQRGADVFITDLSSFTATRPGGIAPIVDYNWTLDGTPYTPTSLPPYSAVNPGFLITGLSDGHHYLKLILDVKTESGELCSSEYCLHIIKDADVIILEEIDCSASPYRVASAKSNAENGVSAEMSIYPNPAYNSIAIDYKLDKLGKATLEIVNAEGVVLATKTLDASKGVEKLDVNGFADGMYICQIRQIGSSTITAKFSVVKQ